MNKKFTTKFIELYRQHPCLWQIKSKDYANKNSKTQAYKALLELCEKHSIKTDIESVKKKIQSLRGAFRKEYNKVLKSISTAKDEEDIYKSSLWYYDLLLFTRDQFEPTEITSNIECMKNYDQREENGNKPVEEFNENADLSRNLDDENSSKVPTEFTSKSTSVDSSFLTNQDRHKRKRDEIMEKEQNYLFKVCKKALANEETNPFGTYVGKKLASIKCESQKMLAETLITNVLQKAVFNKLTETTSITERFPTLIMPISSTNNQTRNYPSGAESEASNFGVPDNK